MNDETYKKYDLLQKCAPSIIAVVGLFFSVQQFNRQRLDQLRQQRDLSVENHKREYKRHVWEKQTEIYLRMGDVVGRIAAGNQDKAQLKKDINEYNAMYWGATNYVEDETVELAMKNLYLAIRALEEHPHIESNVDSVKVLAKRLVETCRQANTNFWFEESQNYK